MLMLLLLSCCCCFCCAVLCSAAVHVPCCTQVYYTGSDLTQVVWSTVRLSMKPSQQWLEGFVAQVCRQRLGGGANVPACLSYISFRAHVPL